MDDLPDLIPGPEWYCEDFCCCKCFSNSANLKRIEGKTYCCDCYVDSGKFKPGVSFPSVPNRILDNLWMGDEFSVQDPEFLVKHGVSRVVQLHPVEWKEDDRLEYLKVELEDQPSADLQLTRILKWMDRGKILVHCGAGQSRSGAIILAYLMKQLEWTYEEALEYVKARRASICVNKGFEKQLKQFEKEIFTPRHPLDVHDIPWQTMSCKR